MSRRQAIVLYVFAGWTIWVWATRIWNILGDDERSTGFKAVHTVLAAVSVVAHLERAEAEPNPQRINVTFERGGWIGPRLGALRPELLARIRQSFPAWLDITVLTPQLRLCRGNAGTIFALLRRTDLDPADLLPA